jgi:hypothetical protein
LDFPQTFSKKYKNIRFHENASSGSPIVPCGRTDGQLTFPISPIVPFGRTDGQLTLAISPIFPCGRTDGELTFAISPIVPCGRTDGQLTFAISPIVPCGRTDGQLTFAISPISRVRLKMLAEIYTVTALKSTPERLEDPPVRRLSLLTTPERAINSSR